MIDVQGPGVAMRMNKTPANASFPVEDLASSDMACGMLSLVIIYLIYHLACVHAYFSLFFVLLPIMLTTSFQVSTALKALPVSYP
jgi:hypothetical protein